MTAESDNTVQAAARMFKSCEESSSSDAMETVSVVFADSRPALELAKRRGLSPSIRIRTNAPAILTDPSYDTEAADELLSAAHIHAIEDGVFAAAHQLYDKTVKEYVGSLNAEDVALVAARVVTGRLQDFLFPAAMLREDDFANPPTVVTPYHERADQRYWFHAGILQFFELDDRTRRIEIPANELPLIEGPQPDEPSLWFRLRHIGLEAYIYKLGLALWERLRHSSGRGCLLIVRENEFLRETATELLKRGYAVRRLPSMSREDNGPASDIDLVLSDWMDDALEAHLPMFFAPSARRKMKSFATTELRRELARYELALRFWDRELEKAPYRDARGALTNMLIDPAHIALQRCLQDRGVPLFGFQHGVTSEIAARQARNIFIQENTWCDVVIAFNSAMAEYCRQSEIGSSEAVVAGVPKVYHKLHQSDEASSSGDMWYISTAIYQGNVGRFHRGLSDPEIYRREVSLLDNVFAHLPHKVVFKPYPVFRYVDADPVLEYAEGIGNIDVYRDGFDFRYLASAARVLVTGGATSTVSWCLMTGRPLVFIDDPDWMPLKPKVREAFAESIFLFDNRLPGTEGQIREFLSRPYEEIERLWREKGAQRQCMIERFIASGDAAAGKRAAVTIESRMTNNVHC